MQPLKAASRVWLPVPLASEMRREAERMYPKETGGVLMGYMADRDMVVTSVVGPGPKAVHGSYSFTPDYDFQEAEIARIYEATGRKAAYLGDWHTHPDGSDRLSVADRKTLKAISNCREARIENPLMVILWGREKWRVTAWRGWRSRTVFRLRKFTVTRVDVVESASLDGLASW